MVDSYLKPCPFCGEDNIHDEPSCIYPISCPKCGAEASQTVWNTRTEDKRIKELESDTSALSAQVNYLDSRAWTSEQRIKELKAQLDRECIWTRVNNSYHCWDVYDAWSTSCGEDYAIEEEWDDKVPNFCNNCGGKAVEAILEKDDE
jgi:hypothetical protein